MIYLSPFVFSSLTEKYPLKVEAHRSFWQTQISTRVSDADELKSLPTTNKQFS